MVIPQSRLDYTSELSTTIKVPNMQVVLGSTWWAMEDRGEELGPRGEKARVRYETELSARVAQEMASQGFDELVND